MSNRIITQHLEVSINGSPIPQVIRFSLVTDVASPFIQAAMDTLEVCGKAGDSVIVTLNDVILFTGEILNVSRIGQYQRHTLTDGGNLLCAASITPAYRKEAASSILSDILDTAGIERKKITVPDVELSRFSSPGISCYTALVRLVETLQEHGYPGLRFFFDADNTFLFGTFADTAKNTDTEYTFSDTTNILAHGKNGIEVFPLPIRHSQVIIINDEKRKTTRTELTCAYPRSRLHIVSEALKNR